MRIIFLDIDGVLNDLNFDSSNPGKFFRPEAVQTLADIVHQTGAKIVLSSTWKHIKDCSKEKYPDAFRQWQQLINTLAVYNLEIFDTTPNINTNRPLEISEWLKTHDDISSWVSIEDDFPPKDYAKYGYENHLFRTEYFVPPNYIGGLKTEHIPQILQMFEEQEQGGHENYGEKV